MATYGDRPRINSGRPNTDHVSSARARPPIPWWNGVGIRPQAAALGSRVFFGTRITQPVRCTLLAGVFLVVPGPAIDRQCQVHIPAVADHFANPATVAILLFSENQDDLLEDQC